MVVVKVKDKEFYLDDILKERLDTLKDIVYNKNWDGVFIIDGLERVGKSTLGISCAYFLSNGSFTVENICADGDDAIKKIESFPDKSVLLIDEGSLMFNSKDFMRKEQKKLIKILNVVGQKNMIFIIILPSFFDLNKSIAIRRSKFLLHCYTDKGLLRGRFAYFGEDAKKVLYGVGKKNYDSYEYPKRSMNELGRYTNFNPLGEEYLATKKKSLHAALHEDETNTKQEIEVAKMKKIVSKMESYEIKGIYDKKGKEKKLTIKDKAGLLGISRQDYYNYLELLKKRDTVDVYVNPQTSISYTLKDNLIPA